MGNRYYITGVRLGILMASADILKSKSMMKLLKEIEKKQYLCEAEELNKLLKDKE